MKIHPILLITGLLLITATTFSQKDSSYKVLLRSGSYIPQKNISPEFVDKFNKSLQRVNGKSFAVFQFEQIPTSSEKQQLAAAGIDLMEYLPDRAYSVSIRGNLDQGLLQRLKIRAILELTPEQKMHPAMAKRIYPSWAVKTPGMIDVWVSFPKTINYEEIKQLLKEKNIEITSDDYKDFHVIGLKIPIQRINELASFIFIEYIEPAPHEDQPLNNESRNNSRGSLLQAGIGAGGFNLKGEGVTIGVGDNSDPRYHIDFAGRLINRAVALHNHHGTHVTGTVGSAGFFWEQYEGYAPRSTIISQLNSGIIQYAGSYVTDHGMVLTNNSYGGINNDCDYGGTYDLVSRILDLQALSLPNLQHVFAAGNDGTIICSPYPASFKTVLGSFQSAKNVITVGATNNAGAITSFSSRGPVKDGRTKPEITANGQSVFSSIPWNLTGTSSGTSMAAPAVTGGTALLYQRYREMNGGANPKNGLMKALICNGGFDLGNSGPDYTYGFGWMNLLRSVTMLNNNYYFISTVSHGGSNNHSILSVPAGTAQLKVMLYWNDPAAAAYASQTLVNDLDLEITAPSSVLPWRLDTLPANVNNPAITAADHINNIEQITIDNPSGNYTVTVKGTTVPTSPQEYFLVYDIIPTETKIVYPFGGVSLYPTEPMKIQWESYGSPSNTFTVEYSTDDGFSWTTINASVAANLRQLSWTIPAGISTDLAKIRVKRNGTAYESTSGAFTIIGLPTISAASTQCEGYYAINWTAVAGATDYEVLRVIGSQMSVVGVTNLTTYTLSGLSRDSAYVVAVRARINGKPGLRSIPSIYVPNTGTCAGSISDNDLLLDSIIAPLSGRLLTSTALTAATQVRARIKNLDDVNVTSFKMRYSLDGGGSWVEETVSATVAPGATYTHSFATTANFLAVGNYELRVEVINLTGVDPVISNNLSIRIIKQLNNLSINLSSVFLDNLETATIQEHITAYTGFNGIDRYDFTNNFIYGRARTFLNTGIAYSGSKAITLDFDGNYSFGVTNFLYGTFNLASYTAAANDLRLDFQYKNHGQSLDASNPYNKVWIRGDDTQPWVEVYDLYANQNDADGTFKKTSSIELSDFLLTAGQNFSTSFQVRWGQYGHVLAADNEGGEGYTFDDIRLYEAIDDIELVSIDTPKVNSCGLNSTVPVIITVLNKSPFIISNIPAHLIVDGGAPVIENIPGPVAPNSTVQYTFTATANLAAFGNHTVLVKLKYPTDNFPENDTIIVNLVNSPVISTFPHIENFESGDGNWYSDGKNNSWQYGVPASSKISRAASGTKAWKTNLAGNYNDREASYLYSPCYNITGMTNPTLSFSAALDLENCGGTFCDGAYIEYSADGLTWTRLGSMGSGTNWYNKNYPGNNLWSVENYTRWHVVTAALPTGLSRLRLRIAISSDPAVNFEGMGVDDIHVYDNINGIYDGVTMGAPVTQTISGGTNWVDFISGGKLVASIQPNNQNMGSTGVQAYINTGSVRSDSRQYYHNRNITIKPTNIALSDSAIVRFYFLDSETETLINATGCSPCTKPSMAADLGVTKYSDPDDNNENGSLADDLVGDRIFLSADWNHKVPFDKGYYIEFRVKDFSEFWLNDGWLNGLSPLPVELLSFNARKKSNNDVLVEWKTTMENNVNRFEIEVAKGLTEYQNRRFVKIGQILSPGNSTVERSYNFTDSENGKNGVRYYRLKIVDNDNRFVYSAIKPVVFTSDVQLQLYPNPSKGAYNLVYQLNDGEKMTLNVYDGNGKLVKQMQTAGNGFIQKVILDLQSAKYSPGIYLLKIEAGEKQQQFKLIKQ